MSAAGMSPLQTADRLRKAGQGHAALDVLREAIRRGQLAGEALSRAGSFIARELSSDSTAGPLLHVRLAGQCTTTWIGQAMVAVAWSQGIALRVTEAAYDNVVQDLSAGGDAPDVLVFMPWNQRLLNSDDRAASARIDDELALWRQVWHLAADRGVGRLIQVGYDWVNPGALGYHVGALPGGDVDTVRRMNDALRDARPDGCYWLPLEELSGTLGRAQFYDPRRYAWTKQPFSEQGVQVLAEHLCAAVRALAIGARKVLVVDLDDTLWGGVVGEVGAAGVALDGAAGESFIAFQTHLKQLAARGVALAVASKNNPDDARSPFVERRDMILTLDDFAAFEAGWEPKQQMLQRIATTLAVGLDSFVFFDDNAAEQEHIRQALPDVAVVSVPPEPAEYVRVLQAGLWFETAGLTGDDLERGARYRIEARRQHAREAATSVEDYLASLDMVGEVSPIAHEDLPRVAQLLAKTNQFNLTTRRHSADHVRRMLDQPGAIGLTLRLRDRFGDHGLVGLAIGRPSEPGDSPGRTLVMDSFLLSCRIIGRTAEHYLMREMLDAAAANGYSTVVGEFIETSKNGPARGFYDAVGFRPFTANGATAGVTWYTRTVNTGERPATFVRPAD